MRSSGLLMAYPVAWISILALYAIVNIMFAFAVAADGKRLAMRGIGTFLVSPGIWGFATLFGGIYVAAAYWLIHHSRLRPIKAPWDAK